ncbi:hypothetical protein KY329_04850 [Candidatus Woesearchaeota archaeon]|nr:hypothetical protein [Candidatus Woesearchaeota archaeon]
MIDVVFPDGNEQEFIRIAKRLGYKSLIFVYEDKKKIGKISSDFLFKQAVLCAPNKVRDMKLLAFCKGSARAREAIERSASMIFGMEDEQKDSLHYRRSGLNQVLCKLAKSKDVAIGFDFNSVLMSRRKARAVIIGRMMQNIVLCRKYKLKMLIASFAKTPYQMRSPSDLRAFFHVLGMQQGEAKQAFGVFK